MAKQVAQPGTRGRQRARSADQGSARTRGAIEKVRPAHVTGGQRLAGSAEGVRDLGPRIETQPGQDLAQVELHGLDAHIQLGGNLSVGLAVSDRPGDCQLTRGERQGARSTRVSYRRQPGPQLGVAAPQERGGAKARQQAPGPAKLPGR